MPHARLVEINFDGIVGPTHNYAGLSVGNLASTTNAGRISRPRAAALQGLAKMRANIALGLTQGIFLSHRRPNHYWFDALATSAEAAGQLWSAATSASPMWAANAATVSPAPDCDDGRCHMTVANLITMPHRSHEWPGTLAQLNRAFAHPAFCVHGPVPAPFGDEGAANHLRLCTDHSAAGIEIFVYGESGGPFPARQHLQASAAIARRHRVTDVLMVRQSDAAISAGAFHNDVVAVANQNVLFAHEDAFAEKRQFFDALRARLSSVEIIEVPCTAISLAEAIATYLFNAQLVSLPEGGMALILPSEARTISKVWAWLEDLVASQSAIRKLVPVDVKESMANGGGPACLRLRVVCDPATVDHRFLADGNKLDLIERVVTSYWPERVDPIGINALGSWEAAAAARVRLLEALDLVELI